MKPQDLIFIAVLVVLIFLRKPKYLVIAGILCIVLSIPLFGFWVFFTAQRLTYYALGFFLFATIYLLAQKNK